MRPPMVDLFFRLNFLYNVAMEHIAVEKFNEWAKEHCLSESMFDNNGNIIMKNKNDYKSTGIIARILEDKCGLYYSKFHTIIDIKRPNAPTEVQKIIDCANKNLGATVYVCNDCDEIYFCSHTCKGKLCSSCGIKSQKIVTEKILETCIHCSHRHITFTIPQELTSWFFNDLKSLDILFDAVSDTLYSVANGRIRKKKIKKYLLGNTPGFFAFLHTFGRPLNFNPHIHVIFAEKIINKLGIAKNFIYLNYDALSKRFQKILLDKMMKYFGKDNFKDTKNKMYLNYPNGFYVNNRLEDDGINFKNIEELIRYVTRYCARPCMAETRIKSYDGENVAYWYVDHKDNSHHEVTVSSFEFIAKLLAHLLPYKFKSIRSYGFYNKSCKYYDKISNRIISKEKIGIRKELLKWKNLILTSFNRIPITCPKCNKLMEPTFEVS